MKIKNLQCVILADRHHGLTEGVRGLLEIVAETVVMVADEVSLFESVERLQPTLAVVDMALIHGELVRWVPRLRAKCPAMKLILISVYDEPTVLRAALRAGADGFVVKRAIATDLLSAVDEVMAGHKYFPTEVMEQPSEHAEKNES